MGKMSKQDAEKMYNENKNVKTALQVFVEMVKCIHGLDLTISAHKEYNNALAKERQQIEDAYYEGNENGGWKYEDETDYYNKTYEA